LKKPEHNSERQLALLNRIHQRFQTITEQLTLGEVTLKFTRIADPNRVLDEVADAEDRREKRTGVRLEDPLHLPYWAELWDSARAIALRLQKIQLTAELNVLDLGCGMGLAGCVAAAMGARVTFADLETPALLFARLNSLPFEDRAKVRQLDWRRDQLDNRFDVILGADILYEKKQWDFLEPFWRKHLADNGTILLGEPGRQTGELFIPWILSRGWKLTESPQLVPGFPKPIRIFQLTAN
jgi:predicted nicotinamide N-methyase